MGDGGWPEQAQSREANVASASSRRYLASSRGQDARDTAGRDAGATKSWRTLCERTPLAVPAVVHSVRVVNSRRRSANQSGCSQGTR